MIEVKGLSKRFGDVQALQDVSFTVERGKIYGFLGANGAGKSTTMDIICGCSGPDTGSISVNGVDMLEQPIAAKQQLGYLPDEPPLHHEMRVEEFIRYAAVLRGVKGPEVARRVSEVTDQLSLGDVRRRLVGNLSKGYKQRVGLAQAIVHNPAVLVLDEPTEGLDPNQIVHIRDLIISLGGAHTVLLSSHILSEVQNTCEQILIINRGRIVQSGTYEEIASAGKKQAYTLRVRSRAEDLKREIEGIKGIHVDSLKVDTMTIEIVDDPAIDEVLKRAMSYGIREFSPARRSLEEVFLELTHQRSN